MSNLFHTFLYEPILNLLVFLYNVVPGHDLGIAIILLTIIIKIVLLPLSKQSIKSQKALQELQPKINEIKAKYASNKEEMGRAMMDLYKQNKVNPFSSCLPLLIQLPFFFAVFKVFKDGLNETTLNFVYPFIDKPQEISSTFLGLVDLSKPSVVLAVLAGGAQFWQAKMMITKKAEVKAEGAKDENIMAAMNKQMLYFMPAITIFIGITLPGGLSLYWFVITILTVLHQIYIFRKDKEIGKVIEGEVIK